MYLSTKINKEYHANGNLMYIETIAVLAPSSAHLYPNRRQHPDGYEWIRIGENIKYLISGAVAWSLKYDEMGNLVKPENK